MAEVLPTMAVLEAGGVGYEILIPLSTFDRLPGLGGELRLWTHLSIREDAHVLYGFWDMAERDLFRVIIQSVSGVGPKMALNLLSAMPPSAFQSAVWEGDVKALSQVSGIGKKTAERILVEMKDKVGPAVRLADVATASSGGASPASGPVEEATRALMALQFRASDAADLARKAADKLGDGATTETIVRECLRK